ncbi:phage holin family protein [Bradyrhizobium sp. dw_78]|uniref:phage holin family protein n=1 Tax=Bradyrhizobium sp. dw_78 TaxID=2719793 RepID=UPI001BD22D3F|nr:phage holin family protein [Bradyrhizobium sp. dw_78]
MNVSRLVDHARVLWRTDRIIAELRLKRLLSGLGLQALAALIASFGLLLFELAAYFALVQVWNAIWSAAALGLINILIAGLLALFALRRPVGHELALATEVHHQAIAALEAEIKNQESGAASLASALASTAIPLLLPLIPLLVQRLRSRKADMDPV